MSLPTVIPLPQGPRPAAVPAGAAGRATRAWRAWVTALVLLWAWLGPAAAWAQGVELSTLKTSRPEGALALEFVARVSLPRTVEDALRSGVPVYFVAEAQVLRDRWYWRDERVSRVSRQWRVAYQPLTGTWRVGLGGLNTTHASLAEALAAASSSSNWRLAEANQLDGDKRYRVEFRYGLDTSQLPGPMQLDLGRQAEWSVGVNRSLQVAVGP